MKRVERPFGHSLSDRDKEIRRRYYKLCETLKPRKAAATIAKEFNIAHHHVREVLDRILGRYKGYGEYH